MNTSIVRYILGVVLKIEGALLLLPCLVALIYRESVGWWYLLCAALCAGIGFLMTLRKSANQVFYLKEGCAATALSWIVLSFFGCLPFYFSGEIPSFVDALFETVSGFTTTGSTILSDVEVLSHCALFWRSFTHWIGGMGILVFLLAIVPLGGGGSSFNLMRAESPGPSVGKLVPKIKETARLLYFVYFGLTLAEFLLLLIGGMPLFDAINTAIATAGTGGFAIKNASIGAYSIYSQWVVAIFMVLFGVNFNAYYLILLKQFRKAIHMEEVRAYLIVYVTAVIIIFISLFAKFGNAFQSLTDSVFQVATLMSSTGFATADFELWPGVAKMVLLCLMFMGACAGSTGGGIKVSRILILAKTIKKEVGSYIHPKSVKKIKIEGKPVEHDVVRSVNVFFATYMLILAFSSFLLSIDASTDMLTCVTASVSALSNMGPGFSLVGPSCNYGFFNAFSKLVIMFDMLAGRLELFPMLILFHPKLWKGALPFLKPKKAAVKPGNSSAAKKPAEKKTAEKKPAPKKTAAEGVAKATTSTDKNTTAESITK